MRSTQMRLREVMGMLRRRWTYPVFSTIVVTGICVVGALTATRRYESTTTILVRPDQTLNPMASAYDVAMASEEQMRNFAEILYSRSVLQALADSVGLRASSPGGLENEAIVKQMQGSVSTTRIGSDSFRMTFVDTDPARAQRGAQAAANLFIQTKLAVENRQNALAVQFYEEKVDEYRKDFESSVKTIVSSLERRLQELPVESRSLYGKIDEIEKNLGTNEALIKSYRSKLTTLNRLPEAMEATPEAFRQEDGKDALFALERSELPYASDLRMLVTQYDQMTRRYQGKYPEVEKVEAQLVEILKRMRLATQAEIARQLDLRNDLEKQRSFIIEDLKKSSVSQQENHDKESSYDIKKKLYDDMKVKLEQARLAQEVGIRGANQFVILDPAIFPLVPTKPNRSMIVLAGVALGFILGVLAGIVAELFDSTVRTVKDIEVYDKPIIALLPDGDSRSMLKRK